MALSNWDTLAVNLKGKAQAGAFISPCGVSVEIYKNWVYLHDPKAWREGGQFCEDVIMELQHGDLQYMDVEIRAVHGPQNGIYVVCWHVDYQSPGKDGIPGPTKYTGMIGCGVSGFDKEDWVGVKPDSVEFLQKWISNKERTWTDEEVDEMLLDLNNPDIDPKDWEQELREDHIFDFPEEIAGVKLDQAIRYNQGNMYFAEKVGMDLDATKPGESDDPALITMLKSDS